MLRMHNIVVFSTDFRGSGRRVTGSCYQRTPCLLANFCFLSLLSWCVSKSYLDSLDSSGANFVAVQRKTGSRKSVDTSDVVCMGVSLSSIELLFSEYIL